MVRGGVSWCCEFKVYERFFIASACRYWLKYATLRHRAGGLAESFGDRYIVKVE